MKTERIIYLVIIIGLVIALTLQWQKNDAVTIENGRLVKVSDSISKVAKTHQNKAETNYKAAQSHQQRIDSLLSAIGLKEKLIKKYENENRKHWNVSDYQSYYDRELGAGSSE